MLAYAVTSSSGLFLRTLWALLLLAASLDAYNTIWDNCSCTEREMSVYRGNRMVMACNISNTFKEVTINLTACGKTRTIFNQMPPGNYSKESWQLQIQGGQAQLVITNAQDIHAGEYSWMLHGRQRNYTDFILNVIGLATKKQEPTSLQVHDESPTTVRTEVIFVIITIIIITGISAFAWYKHRHSLELHKYKFQATGPSHGSPGSPYLTLP